jgi:CBS domain-containing protein
MAEKGQQETRQTESTSNPATSGPAEAGSRTTAAPGKPTQTQAELAQYSADTAERGARAGGSALRNSNQATADVMRRSADAGADTMRHLGSSARDAMEHGARAAAEAHRELVRHTADHVEDVGRRVADAIQDSAREMRAVFVLPALNGRGLQDVRQGLAGMLDGILQTNIRVMQEMLRLANPAIAVEMQRRVASDYLDTFLEQSATILRATRHTAEEALQPLERHVQERQQLRQAGGNGHGTERVADVMERQVRLASPEDTVQRAAELMREEDVGVLPVGEADRLVGMVSDRDVALRLVAEGRDPRQTRVRDVMSPEVRYVFDDEAADHVAENMAEQQVRRLPVVNRDRRLVGIVSLADFTRKGKTHLAAKAVAGISRPGGLHPQAAE